MTKPENDMHQIANQRECHRERGRSYVSLRRAMPGISLLLSSKYL
jgi:hypothetical protein